MKNLKKILIVFLVLILIGGIMFFKYTIPNYRNINFDEVYQCDIDANTEIFNKTYWFSIRDNSYNGFFDIGYLDKIGVDCSKLDFDYSKYTYIITIGYELSDISYSYHDMKNRKLIFIPKQFIGKVKLKKEFDNKVYIYKIKKMDIDCDYHNRSKNVEFVN